MTRLRPAGEGGEYGIPRLARLSIPGEQGSGGDTGWLARFLADREAASPRLQAIPRPVEWIAGQQRMSSDLEAR